MSKIRAVIPVRAGSRRLPNKNISEFGGTNLLEWKIKQLQSTAMVDSITVTSDSKIMLEIAEKNGADTHLRAEEYCDEKTECFGKVVQHVCENVTGEHILWATCTSPLVLPENYEGAIKAYFEALENGYDSLMSVEPFKRYIWKESGPVNYGFGVKHVPSQELEQLYFVTDGILLAPRLKMIEWSYFHGHNPKAYPLDKIHCVDIDDKLDLAVAKAWLDEME